MANQRISLKDVKITLNNYTVGGAQELTCTVTRDNAFVYEGGTYHPVDILDGKFEITGSLTRHFIDIDLINDFCPNQDLWPSFVLVGEISNSKTPGRTVTITGAKFDSFDISGLNMDGPAENALPFKALNWKLD